MTKQPDDIFNFSWQFKSNSKIPVPLCCHLASNRVLGEQSVAGVSVAFYYPLGSAQAPHLDAQ